jgi:membrane protein
MEGQVNLKVISKLLSANLHKMDGGSCPTHGRGLGLLYCFSLAPLLLIVIAIAGLVFGQEAAEGQIIAQIQGFVGEDSARAIQGMLENACKPSTGLIATCLALVTLLSVRPEYSRKSKTPSIPFGSRASQDLGSFKR